MREYIQDVSDEDKEDTDVSNKVYATTKGGKDIVISARKGYWFIKFTTGGQLPKDLSGRYTRYSYASDAVDAYLSKEPEPKVEVKKAPAKKTKN